MKKGSGISATELCGGVIPSKQNQSGRLLKLRFVGDVKPELLRIEFRFKRGAPATFWHKGHPKNPLSYQEFAHALSLLLLQHVRGMKLNPENPPEFVGNKKGSFAATIGNVFTVDEHRVHKLFAEPEEPYPDLELSLPNEAIKSCSVVERLFFGDNWDGKKDKPRRFEVEPTFLPLDCIEIWWEARNPEKLTKVEDVHELIQRIRKSVDLDPLPDLPESPPLKESPHSEPEKDHRPDAPISGESSAPKSLPETTTGKANRTETEKVNKTRSEKKEEAGSVGSAGNEAQKAKFPEIEPKFSTPDSDPEPEEEDSDQEPEAEPRPPIDPNLFKVIPSGHVWDIHTSLVYFGDENVCPPWTLQNAFEGVLILGATGSGKSTGSGITIAESFLRAGFGGLVLTVKRDEAEHWRKLCAYCGRADDFICVSRGGDWKLNILDYEAQCPGRGSGLAANLVALCNTLLAVSTRSQGSMHKEQVWQHAGDQLLQATFDLFLLSGLPVTFDLLAEFISRAPTEILPQSEESWLKIPVFGKVVAYAKKKASTEEDKRLLKKSTDYWLKVYAGYPGRIRTSVTLGIYAMLDAFRSRDIPAIISSETNFTPQSILSGKIVVLDLPLKELHHTGLVVQSAIKFIVQKALESQGNSNDPNRRPVFLWEDEGQYFVSDHDFHFQDTARSSRVSKVLLSQNIHSFYKELGTNGHEAANSLFGNLNTKIFHANSDPHTNQWASQLFGSELRHRASTNFGPPKEQPMPKDFLDAVWQLGSAPSGGASGTTAGNWEPAVRPEEFNLLRTGGEHNHWLVDAYVSWLGLGSQAARHFTAVTFEQNRNL